LIQALVQQTGGSVRQVCKVLGQPRSSFYQAATPTARHMADAQLGAWIETIFHHHRKRYGYRRVARVLADRGITCASSRIRRLMAQRALRALQPRNFVPKTSDGRADQPSPNLLRDRPLPVVPDQVWTGDITFIPTSAGWLYLAIVLDLGSRRIVGWSLANHLRGDLVLAALHQALQTRCVDRTIFHSDRGSQYASSAFRKALAKAGLRQSMSSRANPYDNAWTESFIGTLKHELLQGGCFQNAADAHTEIFEYIEGYYNTHRKHSALNYLSPTQFEARLHSTN
jgi:transposase InsO family protein